MSQTLLLTRRDVIELLPMRDCIDAVEAAFRAQALPSRLPSGVLGLHFPEGGLHVKAAGLELSRRYVAAKLNANIPSNPERRGLPTIQGLLVLVDGEDGRPLAVMDSAEITALRTAAATAVAARHMSAPQASCLAVCGCGVQAEYQIRALSQVRPLRRVRVFDRDPARARDLAARFAGDAAPEVTVASEPARALREAELIVTCTPSKRPVLTLADVSPGCFVAGVGADNPEKHELEPGLLAAARVVVDSLEQAAAIGDLHHALESCAMRREDVAAELWELVAGVKPGRGAPDQISVFDSTGVAIQDVAAAAAVYERASREGRGRQLDFGN